MNLTGYYLLEGRIHGPQRDGEFWVDGDRIRSAEDPVGRFVVHADGHIVGPHGHTAFRIDRTSGHILGPHPVLPWLHGEQEEDESTDALGG